MNIITSMNIGIILLVVFITYCIDSIVFSGFRIAVIMYIVIVVASRWWE